MSSKWLPCLPVIESVKYEILAKYYLMKPIDKTQPRDFFTYEISSR